MKKSLVKEDRIAFIESLNLETKNGTDTQYKSIIKAHQHEVAQLIICFETE